jgi:hypothetical protein
VSAIKVGDLVVVVRGCAYCGDESLGEIFTVARVQEAYGAMTCCGIGAYDRDITASAGHPDEGVPIGMLKRIPPLDELERDQIVKELTA